MVLELENIETAFPAVVVKSNKDGTVDCRPSIHKVYPNGVFDLENKEIPGIPLMKLGGASAEFSFPIRVNDHVLLVAFSRDATKWKEGPDDGDVVPESASGLSLMDLVAIPFVKAPSEAAAKVCVTEEGDIVFTPAKGRKMVCDSDFVCRGKVLSVGEVAAGCSEVGGDISDLTAVHLSTHIHVTPSGASDKPTPGT